MSWDVRIKATFQASMLLIVSHVNLKLGVKMQHLQEIYLFTQWRHSEHANNSSQLLSHYTFPKLSCGGWPGDQHKNGMPKNILVMALTIFVHIPH